MSPDIHATAAARQADASARSDSTSSLPSLAAPEASVAAKTR